MFFSLELMKPLKVAVFISVWMSLQTWLTFWGVITNSTSDSSASIWISETASQLMKQKSYFFVYTSQKISKVCVTLLVRSLSLILVCVFWLIMSDSFGHWFFLHLEPTCEQLKCISRVTGYRSNIRSNCNFQFQRFWIYRRFSES